MKKLSIMAILSLAVIACKNDKNTTKIDTKTGETTYSETISSNVNEAISIVEKTPAISEKDGVYTQIFKLEKGQTYPLNTLQKGVQTITSPEGKKMSATTQSSDDMSFTVNDFKDGVYDITINLSGKNSSQTADGKTVSIDTKKAAPTDPNLKIMWAMNKALVGNTLTMKMKENGEIVSVAGFDTIYKKMTTTAGQQIKNTQEKNAFLESFKQSFNENSIKEQFSKNLMILPKTGAKIVQKWTETENASPDVKIKLTTHYTLKSVENGLVTITVSGGIPKQSDKKTQQGMTHSVSSELSQNGTIVFDQNTGWIKSQNITVVTNQSETLSDGKQSQTMKSTTSTSVTVNP